MTTRASQGDGLPLACRVGGLLGCLAWASMLAVVFRLPSLGSRSEVVGYWLRDGLHTQVVIAVMACGYPGVVLFLAGLGRGWPAGRRHWAGAARLTGAMFTTALVVALGLASAAGQLATTSPAYGEVAYALHVGAFVLAAPAAGLGAGFFVCVLAGGRGADRPLARGVAIVGLLANLGPLGGHFALTGIWNTGNGWLSGMTLPVASLVAYVVVACVSGGAAWREDHGPRGASTGGAGMVAGHAR